MRLETSIMSFLLDKTLCGRGERKRNFVKIHVVPVDSREQQKDLETLPLSQPQ